MLPFTGLKHRRCSLDGVGSEVGNINSNLETVAWRVKMTLVAWTRESEALLKYLAGKDDLGSLKSCKSCRRETAKNLSAKLKILEML